MNITPTPTPHGVRLVIEGSVPSVNHYWQAKGKMRFLSQEGKQFKAAMAFALRKMEPFSAGARLFVTLLVSFPDKRRRDVDNIQKALFDSLLPPLGADDEQIDGFLPLRCPPLKGGRVVVEIGVKAEAWYMMERAYLDWQTAGGLE